MRSIKEQNRTDKIRSNHIKINQNNKEHKCKRMTGGKHKYNRVEWSGIQFQKKVRTVQNDKGKQKKVEKEDEKSNSRKRGELRRQYRQQ